MHFDEAKETSNTGDCTLRGKERRMLLRTFKCERRDCKNRQKKKKKNS